MYASPMARRKVSSNWQWATLALVGVVGVQFWWWNKQAPEVLNLGGNQLQGLGRRGYFGR